VAAVLDEDGHGGMFVHPIPFRNALESCCAKGMNPGDEDERIDFRNEGPTS
jgi:hypothetical protein